MFVVSFSRARVFDRAGRGVRAALVGALTVAAAGAAWAADEPGSDHPAVSRYPGAVLRGYDFKEYEEAQLVLGKPVRGGPPLPAEQLLPVEGRVTYLHYEIPPAASALQVFRNYQSMLRRSGFKELFVCNRPCFDGNLGELKTQLKARQLYLNGHQDIQFLGAQRGDTYVWLAVNNMGSSTDAWVFVIDKAALDDGKMAIAGESPMARALADHGRVDVYGFYFDSGKAVLRPESAATLSELAQVLKDNPDLAVQVLGHTDDVGLAAANQTLSQARAQAVVDALVARQGIAVQRLQVSGRGAGEPIAGNHNEQERAKNRRVEIVAVRAATDAGPVAFQRPTAAPSGARAPTAASTDLATAPAPAPVPKDNSADGSKKVSDVIDKLKSLKSLLGR